MLYRTQNSLTPNTEEILSKAILKKWPRSRLFMPVLLNSFSPSLTHTFLKEILSPEILVLDLVWMWSHFVAPTEVEFTIIFQLQFSI